MAESPSPIDPDRILEHPFTAVRKGYDPLEVQRYLLQVANQLRSAREREAELRSQLEQAEKRTAPIDQLDPSQLTRLLGQETARVLEAAQSASEEIRSKAEENVARLLREARDEAQKTREDADSVLTRKTAEAEEAAARVRAEADDAAVKVRTEADEAAAAQKAEADELLESARAESAELVEAGRREGRDMVAEAQKVRQRMLDDLSRRRKLLRQQIEQLQAGRDRLLAAYDVVRETLDVATEELQVALPEAKLAAETASLRGEDDDDATFEAEVADAAAADDDASPSAAEPEPEAVDAVDPSDAAEEAGPDEGATDDTDAIDDTALGADEGVEPATEAEAPVAPDPVEGRHSSSVRIVRTESSAVVAEGDKAAEVFARLRQEEVVEVDDDHEVVVEADVLEIEVIETALGNVDAAMAAEAEAEAASDQAAGDESDDDAVDEVDEVDELVVRRDAAVAELERNLARRLKRELSDEQNELLASLAATKGVPSADDVLPAAEAHVERYQAIALPTLVAAATAGADLVSTVAGPPAAPTSVADLAAELAADLVAPLRERLERAFSGAEGHTDDVAQSIRACYREWKGQRVDQVASHSVVAACNRGLLDRLPEGTKVRWVVSDGDTPSPDCDDNALAGSVPRGEPFPTGHTAPPLHATCRCMVVPAEA